MNIKINVVGQVVAGNREVGSFIKVLDDAESTGGFLILMASTSEMGDCFDDWVENEKALRHYFIESGWTILWL